MGWVEQGTKIPVIHFWEWKKGKEEITHGWRRKEMKQNLPKELLKSEQGERNMNWCQSWQAGGKGNFNSVQTGRVNKEFQGLLPSTQSTEKPQSHIRISHSL